MDKRLQLIQPFIYADHFSIRKNEKEMSKPFHLYFYELAPTKKEPLKFSFIASPYTEWIIGYDNVSFFNGNSCFWGIGASDKPFSIEIPYFQHFFGVRFDDDMTFFNKTAHELLPADMFCNIQKSVPTGNTYEYKLIEDFHESESFSQRVSFFLSYLKASKKLSTVSQSANILQNALKEAASDMPIVEIAKRYDYTPRHISRLFKDNFGYSPKDYMKFLRIQRVLSAMLRNPDGTNNTFREGLRYNDAAHFQREFKEFLGVTPREYLQKIR